MPIRRTEPRALVERDLALNHVQMAARRSWAGGIEDMQEWGAAEFDPEPLVIYDLNGEPLFYEFAARDNKRDIGRVKAAASRYVGSPVVTLERGPRKWDPARAMEMATGAAKKAFPRQKIEAKDFVCYSFPKIAVRVLIGGPGGTNVLYDVSDGSLIATFGDDQREGQTAWSFIDSMSADKREGRLRRFDESNGELDAARRATPELFQAAYSRQEAAAIKAKLAVVSDYQLIPFYSSKVLKYAPRCTPHDCFALYSQQTNVWCAVATGQMILDFYRYNFDQAAIAAAMGTDASGTSFSGQEMGYESLSNGCLDAGHDFSADWSEAKSEIDANRPVKSGISGHARACAGWKRQNISLIGVPPKRWLQIYDPWPWNADICQGGAVYWEDWNAVTHTNFCYVRHQTTPHA